MLSNQWVKVVFLNSEVLKVGKRWRSFFEILPVFFRLVSNQNWCLYTNFLHLQTSTSALFGFHLVKFKNRYLYNIFWECGIWFLILCGFVHDLKQLYITNKGPVKWVYDDDQFKFCIDRLKINSFPVYSIYELEKKNRKFFKKF